MYSSAMFSQEATDDAGSGEDVDLRPLVLWANLLDAHRTELMASFDALVLTLAQDVRTEESTREGVARAIGVHDLLVLQREDIVHLGLRRLGARDGGRRLGPLRDDDRARARGVRFGERCDGRSDCGKVLLLRLPGRDRPRLRLGLVPNDDIDVWHDLLQLDLEELGDERRREVQHEDLQGERSTSGGALADGGKEGPPTLPASDAFLLSSSADSLPCVRKKPSM